MAVVIVPDDFASAAKVLLDLADRPRDVQTSTDYSRLALVVPDYLYERWQHYQSLESSPREMPKKNGSKK